MNVNRVATLVTTILTTMVLLPLPLYFIRKQNSHCQLTITKVNNIYLGSNVVSSCKVVFFSGFLYGRGINIKKGER